MSPGHVFGLADGLRTLTSGECWQEMGTCTGHWCDAVEQGIWEERESQMGQSMHTITESSYYWYLQNHANWLLLMVMTGRVWKVGHSYDQTFSNNSTVHFTFKLLLFCAELYAMCPLLIVSL